MTRRDFFLEILQLLGRNVLGKEENWCGNGILTQKENLKVLKSHPQMKPGGLCA